MKTQLLKLVELSDLRTASDERQYFVAGFQPAFGQRLVRRTFWQQFKRDSKTGMLTPQKYWERGSYEDAKALLESGEMVEGMKITRTVSPYKINEGTENEREVSTYSTIVFPDENILSVFSAAGHEIIDSDSGEVLNPKKAILAPANAGVNENAKAFIGEEEEEQD